VRDGAITSAHGHTSPPAAVYALWLFTSGFFSLITNSCPLWVRKGGLALAILFVCSSDVPTLTEFLLLVALSLSR
jgi:hypothetical protein